MACKRAIITDEFGRLIVDDLDYISDILNNPFDEFRVLSNANRTDGRIDVNTASVKDLQSLPGIGPKKAKAIHDFINEGAPELKRPHNLRRVTEESIADDVAEEFGDSVRLKFVNRTGRTRGDENLPVRAFAKQARDGTYEVTIAEPHIREQFSESPWRTPRVDGVEALPDEFFQDPDDWVQFVVNHELHHVRRGLAGERAPEVFEEENIVNQLALKDLKEKRFFQGSRGFKRVEDIEELRPILKGNFEKIKAKLDIDGQQAFEPDTEFALRSLGSKKLDDFFFGKINTSPLVRLIQNTKSESVRKLAARLFETAGLSFTTDASIRQAMPVETLIKRWDRPLVRALQIRESAYEKYFLRSTSGKKGKIGTERDIARQLRQTAANGKGIVDTRFSAFAGDFTNLHGELLPMEFDRRLSIAMFMGDKDTPEVLSRIPGMRITDEIPEITEAAQAIREELFNPMLEELLNQRLISSKDLEFIREQSQSYFHRVYDIQRIQSDPRAMENDIADWMVTEQIAQPTDARLQAKQMVQSVLETPMGRISELDNLGDLLNVAGANRKRRIPVPDEVLLPYLDLNFDGVARAYVKTVAPDIEIARFIRSARPERVKVRARNRLVEGAENTGDPEAQRGFLDDLAEASRRVQEDGVNIEEAYAPIRKALADDPTLVADMKQKDIDAMVERVYGPSFERSTKEILDISKLKRVTTAPMGYRAATRKAQDLFDLADAAYVQLEVAMDSDLDGVSEFAAFLDARKELGEPWKLSFDETKDRIESGIGQWDTPSETPGKLDFSVVRDWIREDYANLRKKLDDERDTGRIQQSEYSDTVRALSKREVKDWNTFESLIEMMRNRHIHAADQNSAGATRIFRGLRRFNVLTMAGGFAMSSIPDLGRLATIDGVMPLFEATPLLLKKGKFKPSLDELQDLSIAYEQVLNQRASLMSETSRHLSPTAFEQGLEFAADQMFMLNLMSPWNDATKHLAAHLTHRKVARIANQVLEGAEVPESMLRMGLDGPMLKRISRQMKKYKVDEIEGVPVTKFSKWDDVNALTAYQDILRREVDNVIITPGVGDRPIIMSQEVFKTVLQYKSFAMAATNRMLLGGVQRLQAGDRLILQQVASMVALGAMVEILKAWQYDYRAPRTIPDLIAAGVDRSGIFGIYGEVDGLIQAATGGTVSASRLIGASKPSPYIRNRLPGIILGPSFSRIPQAADLMDAIASGDMSPRHVSHIRNMIPMQNLFYFSWLFDQIEDPAKRAVRNN